MYCSTCGAETSVELNYCHRCGASLNPPVNEPQGRVVAPTSFGKMALIVGLMLVLGLGLIFSGANGLARKGVNPIAIAWMTIFGFATLFAVTSKFMRLWSQIYSVGVAPEPTRQPQAKRQQTIAERARTGQLPPPSVSFTSVTENTTRTLEPISRDSNTRDGLSLDPKV